MCCEGSLYGAVYLWLEVRNGGSESPKAAKVVGTGLGMERGMGPQWDVDGISVCGCRGLCRSHTWGLTRDRGKGVDEGGCGC